MINGDFLVVMRCTALRGDYESANIGALEDTAI